MRQTRPVAERLSSRGLDLRTAYAVCHYTGTALWQSVVEGDAGRPVARALHAFKAH